MYYNSLRSLKFDSEAKLCISEMGEPASVGQGADLGADAVGDGHLAAEGRGLKEQAAQLAQRLRAQHTHRWRRRRIPQRLAARYHPLTRSSGQQSHGRRF